MRILLAGAVLALAAPVAIAGCGGDEGGDEDPAEVLRNAFGEQPDYDSGVLNISLNASVEGESSGSFDAEVSGPFSAPQGEVPELQLDATASANAENLPDVPGGSFSFDFDGGFALADDSLFVTYNDTTYEASQELYSQISPLLETAEEAGPTGQDPEETEAFIDALSNLENEGTEDVEGEEVIHVSGDLDFQSLIDQAGGTVPFDPAQLEGLGATLDVYAASEDQSFRRIDFGFSAGEGEARSAQGIDALDFSISVGISDPNSEQEITAPSDAQPLDDLLSQFGTSEAELGQLLSGGALIPGLGGGLPGGGLPGGGLPGSGGDVADCIAQAEPGDAEALEACLQ